MSGTLRAVVLAGGRGTRLAPYTTSFPKPLVPIGDLPILEIVLRQLRWYGIEEAILSVGHLAALIEAYFITRDPIPGLKITYLRESKPLGTAGALALLDGSDDNLVVVNGDVLTTLNFAEMIAFHARREAVLTIAVHPRTVHIDLGVLEVDEQSNVVDYREKPSLEYLCSMGVYLYSRKALEAIEPDVRLDFPDLVLRMLGEGHRVASFREECFWLDIGRPDDYEKANAEFSRMRHQFLPDELSDPSDSVTRG